MELQQTITGKCSRKAFKLSEKIQFTKDIENRKDIIFNIMNDIKNGIYDAFPLLKKRLNILSAGLYISNFKIDRDDILILVENEYL